ncbi:unnamed protein product [Polarella glacialis]|uniref:Uncharacterized protein n=1 Tax=Polarella glacialis TaxID=89957 RepID=A0A813KN85_POLGL|nr:unnamed protein product [Polarella glacialis]
MAILVARHGERLDYALRAAGQAWIGTAERPWDPPLTRSGRLQAAALGRAIARHGERLGLPPLTRIFTSPFVRCFQTGADVAKIAGLASMCVEPSLGESLCESFYRSWAVPGADSTWGGPSGCGVGVPVDEQELHAAALAPAWELLPPERLVPDEERSMNLTYQPLLPLAALQFGWKRFESEEEVQKRTRAFFDHVAASFPGETVLLISHGGPTAALAESVSPIQNAPNCGYCGLYMFQRSSSEASWQALLRADGEHLQEVDAPTSGPNDLVEQVAKGGEKRKHEV